MIKDLSPYQKSENFFRFLNRRMNFWRGGQSLIEVFIALGVGVLMLSGITGAFSIILRTNDFSEKTRNASILNDGLAEMARSFADGNWSDFYALSNGSGNTYHLVNSGGIITPQSGGEELTLGVFDYTKSFYVENVSRDLNDDIEDVYDLNNEDPLTQKVTVSTEYEVSGLARTISTSFYVTRMRNFVFHSTDWSGGDGQTGPITEANNEFFEEDNIDYTTVPGSILPVTTFLNNIYVADLDNDRIQKFDDQGNYLLQWGEAGTGNGQFRKPYGVAIDSLNNIYVVDKDNDRIQKFDSSGNFLFSWGSGGSGEGQFGHPQGVAIDSDSNIYVVDLDRDRIQKFNSDGDFLDTWGTNGNGDGQFNKPQDIAIDGSDNVYVTDQDNSRVQKFDTSGNFLLKWGANGSGNGQFKKPVGIGADPDGNVYVADRDNDRVQKFDTNGNFLIEWGSTGSGNGQFQKPQGATVDQDGYVYIADGNNHRVQKFDSSGNFQLTWGDSGSANGEFNHPRGLEQVPATCDPGCTLTSSTFDTGLMDGASFNTVMWQGSQPDGTSVNFQIASSNSSSGPWNYVGPGDSAATYYSPAGPNIQKEADFTDHGNKRYFRYKIFFEISGATIPRVDNIILGFSR